MTEKKKPPTRHVEDPQSKTTETIKYILAEILKNVNSFICKKSDKFLHLNEIAPEDVDSHITGEHILGIKPENRQINSVVSFGCIDIDLYKKSEKENIDQETLLSQLKQSTEKVFNALVKYGFSPLIEISKSGQGTHLWLFFPNYVDREALQQILLRVIRVAGFDKSTNGLIEIFPKGLKGNLGVWLPFYNFNGQLRSKFISLDFQEINLDVSDLDRSKQKNDRAFKNVSRYLNYPPCVLNAALNWKKGNRDGFTCGLSGVFKNCLKESVETAIEVITQIAKENKDEELDLREAAIRHTFSKDNPGGCGILQGSNETITVSDKICETNCSFHHVNQKKSEPKNKDDIVDLGDTHIYAKELKKKFHVLCDSRGILWVWNQDTGIWHYNGTEILEFFLENDPNFLPIRKRKTVYITEIIRSVKRQSYILGLFRHTLQGLSEEGLFPTANLDLIPFSNGVYNLATGKLEKYKPEHYLTVKLPISYTTQEPNYSARLLKGFVRSEDLITLQEIMSYCLYRDNPAQLMFLLKGSGANGKSLFMKLLAKLVGESNVSARNMISLMSSKYSFGSLYNKLVNDGGELPIEKSIFSPELLKAIGGEDYVEAEVKYENTIKFRNYAKMFFHGNYLPKTSDTSKGFFRRFMIIDFPYTYDDKTIKSMSRKLVEKAFKQEELDALGSFLARTLRKLKKNSFVFTNHPDWQETKKIYELESQPLFRFVKEHCIIDNSEDSYISKYEFKNKLAAWINRKGTSNPYTNDRLIHQEMVSLGVGDARKRIQVDGESKQFYVWSGIKWKSDIENNSDDQEKKKLSKELLESLVDPSDLEESTDDTSFQELVNELEILENTEISEVIKRQEVDLIKEEIDNIIEVDNIVEKQINENKVSKVNISTTESLNEVVEFLNGVDFVGLDIETYGEQEGDALDTFKNFVRLISLGNEDKQFVIDVTQHSYDDIKNILLILSTKNVIGHNLKFDYKTLTRIYGLEILPKNIFDTFLAARILQRANSTAVGGNGLGEVINKYLGISIDKSEQTSNWGFVVTGKNREKLKSQKLVGSDYINKMLSKLVPLTESQLEYAKNDIKYLIPLSKVLVEKLNAISVHHMKEISVFGCKDYICNLEQKFLINLIKMELAGVAVNREALEELLDLHDTEYEILKIKIKEKFNIDNPNSQQQILEILQKDGVMVKVLNEETLQEETKLITNTSKAILDQVDHPLAKMVNELRSHLKMKGMIEGYLKTYSDGRLHANFNQILNTGRMSCKDPNIQQIPRNIKDIFYKEEEGKSLIKIDYPAIELRIIASHLYRNYNDNTMIKTFQANLDPHKATAALIYNKSIDEVTKEERQSAKAINFGLSYGQGADSFREYAKTYGVHITREQAAEFKEKFRNAVPGLKKWHFEVGKKLKESAPIRVETLDGRILMVDKYTDALNYSIQGTGGGMSKLAINIFYRKLEDLPHLKPCTNVVNVVHDEIAVETNSEYKDEVAQLLKESMELAANFILRYFVTEVDID